MGLIELNRGFDGLLFLAFKLRLYAKQNGLNWNCFDI